MTADDTSLDNQIAALDSGRGFVDRSYVHKTLVAGADAETWLNDLITAGVEEIEPEKPAPSLLLSPTGHILAMFHVARTGDGFVLIQEPNQPEPIDGLLAKYVLSSKVTLEDVTDSVPAFETSDGIALHRPDGLEEVARDAAEAARIRRGEPAFPVDTGLKALPAEAGWESLIDFGKGCFLGQESVAKVRNLGHPPALLLGLRTIAPAGIGDPVFVEGDSEPHEVGTVTSTTPLRTGSAVIARIAWNAREARLATMGLGELRLVDRLP
jgi:folate-binding protein YgfZ